MISIFQSDLGYVKKTQEYTNVINYESFYVHRHSFWEFFVILEGTTKHYFNEDETTLKRGDLVLIHPGNDYHYFIDSSVPAYEHRDLYATTDIFKSVCALIDENLYPCLLSEKRMMKVSLSESELKYFKPLLNDLYRDQLRHESQSIACSYIPLLSAFTGLFAREYLIDITGRDKQFNDFIALINTRKFVCGTIDEIVAASNYSHGYLCRLFKEKMGETLKSYHVKLKVNYAIGLLAKGEKSILDISTMLGYDSLSNFIHVFKSYVGTTPARYRRDMFTPQVALPKRKN